MSLSELVHLDFIPWGLAGPMTMCDSDSEFSGCS